MYTFYEMQQRYQLSPPCSFTVRIPSSSSPSSPDRGCHVRSFFSLERRAEAYIVSGAINDSVRRNEQGVPSAMVT